MKYIELATEVGRVVDQLVPQLMQLHEITSNPKTQLEITDAIAKVVLSQHVVSVVSAAAEKNSRENIKKCLAGLKNDYMEWFDLIINTEVDAMCDDFDQKFAAESVVQ